MERQQFTFYSEYYEAVKGLTKKERANAICAICNYSLSGELPKRGELSKTAETIFRSLIPQMDVERRQSVEGRKCREYKDWRQKIYERDNYTCQVCGSHGVKLNAHHKKSYAHHPRERYDVNNGITLCEKCHKDIHRRK